MNIMDQTLLLTLCKMKAASKVATS